jgi:hypothetical protein
VAATAPGGSQLYYFNNDTSRLCYTFAVSGSWKLDEKSGVMSSADMRLIGQSVKTKISTRSAMRPPVPPRSSRTSASLLNRSRRWPRRFETKDKATFTLARFRHVDAKVRAMDGVGRVATTKNAMPRSGSAKCSPRSIASRCLLIEATATLRAAIRSLGTQPAARCYWPFIREHFPQVKWR